MPTSRVGDIWPWQSSLLRLCAGVDMCKVDGSACFLVAKITIGRTWPSTGTVLTVFIGISLVPQIHCDGDRKNFPEQPHTPLSLKWRLLLYPADYRP